MKILMDENPPHELRPLLMPMHDVFTVAFMGWAGIANGLRDTLRFPLRCQRHP
jgi:hypothetical protein